MQQPVGYKTIEIDGIEHQIAVYASKSTLRARVERARAVRNFEMEAEARAEAIYAGSDLGIGYSAH
jgi:hypothetical protein